MPKGNAEVMASNFCDAALKHDYERPETGLLALVLSLAPNTERALMRGFVLQECFFSNGRVLMLRKCCILYFANATCNQLTDF